MSTNDHSDTLTGQYFRYNINDEEHTGTFFWLAYDIGGERMITNTPVHRLANRIGDGMNDNEHTDTLTGQYDC